MTGKDVLTIFCMVWVFLVAVGCHAGMTMQEQIDAAFTEGLSDYLAKEAEEDECGTDESSAKASV